jgi:hypothetical protein
MGFSKSPKTDPRSNTREVGGSEIAAVGRKVYEQRERRYVPEFVQERYKDRVSAMFNMAIGPAPEELHRKYPDISFENFRRWRFWIDAVVILQDRLVLIEGKLRKPQEGLGQLLVYEHLLSETPELAPYAHLPVQMVLVTPKPDPRVIGVCGTLGITVEIYKPDWVTEYLRSEGYQY